MRASLAFSVHAILATLPFVFGDTTKSISLCTTSFGKTSKTPVPTTTFGLTFTSRATVKSTSTPKQTITPAPTTNTYSTTTTNTVTVTLPQATDTITETDTETQTSTESTSTTVTTTTTTTTSTTTTNTVTIAASAGFTPVSSNVPAKRDLSLHPKQPRAARLVFNPKHLPTTKITLKNGKQTCSPAIYPTQVACAVLAEVFTTTTLVSTAPVQTVTAPTPPPLSTTTTYGTTVTTTTTPVAASTTVTTTTTTAVTTTTTSTSTVTETATATVTVQAPEETYYAACGPSNQQSTLNGAPITNGYYNYGLSSVAANSAYDCCVACLTDSTCGVTAYQAGLCIKLSNGGTCSQTNAVLQVTHDSSNSVFTVSNTYCGVVTY